MPGKAAYNNSNLLIIMIMIYYLSPKTYTVSSRTHSHYPPLGRTMIAAETRIQKAAFHSTWRTKGQGLYSTVDIFRLMMVMLMSKLSNQKTSLTITSWKLSNTTLLSKDKLQKNNYKLQSRWVTLPCYEKRCLNLL